VLGPVYDATHNPPSVGSAVFTEVIGVILVYVAVFGELRGLPSRFSRVGNVFIFAVAGVALLVVSFDELRRAGGGELIGIIVGLAIGIPLIGFEFFRWLRLWGSSSWPTAEGTVESVDVREVRTRSTHYFALEAAYSYSLNGEYYSGRFTRNFGSESEAWDYADSLKGGRVPLRYNPANMGI
jgi:hypothetical protein